jgi:Asp/Glu/hydantoin racemase
MDKGGQDMRLRVIFPSARSVYPDREVNMRMDVLKKYCGPNTELEFGFPASGCTFKRDLTWRDFEPIIPEFVAAAQKAEEEGVDAVMVHCVYDPGYAEIRRLLKIPVVGFGESVFNAALQIAPTFGMIAPNTSLMKEANDILDQFNIRDRCVHMEPLNFQLPEAHASNEAMLARAAEIAVNAKNKGAGVVIPFGMALIPVHLKTEDIKRLAGIPVLNPAEIGLREAQIIMEAVA